MQLLLHLRRTASALSPPPSTVCLEEKESSNMETTPSQSFVSKALAVTTKKKHHSPNNAGVLSTGTSGSKLFQMFNHLPTPSQRRRKTTKQKLIDQTIRSSSQAIKPVVWKEHSYQDCSIPTIGPMITVTKENGETFYLEDPSQYDDASVEYKKQRVEMIERELEDLVGKEVESILRPGSRVCNFHQHLEGKHPSVVVQSISSADRSTSQPPRESTSKSLVQQESSSSFCRPNNYVDFVSGKKTLTLTLFKPGLSMTSKITSIKIVTG
ncbi:hypothetical protein QBC38DRAFT_522331 [Podospora fimiseda]|uniref:Uncharacterized protein n=1 Tax=Podospora fimiseda TaxID=252190 RepID=A0AAN6YS35_9PEZI|nr:hypothetical protein QBC38DRAFT_522331 [Podospora fimiseda]